MYNITSTEGVYLSNLRYIKYLEEIKLTPKNGYDLECIVKEIDRVDYLCQELENNMTDLRFHELLEFSRGL